MILAENVTLEKHISYPDRNGRVDEARVHDAYIDYYGMKETMFFIKGLIFQKTRSPLSLILMEVVLKTFIILSCPHVVTTIIIDITRSLTECIFYGTIINKEKEQKTEQYR